MISVGRFLICSLALQLAVIIGNPACADEPVLPRLGARCGPELVEYLLTGKIDRDQPFTLAQAKAEIKDSIKRGLKRRVILTKLGKFIFYPTIAPFRLYQAYSESPFYLTKDARRSIPFEFIRKDGLTIVGFLVFLGLMDGSPLEVIDFYLLPKVKNDDFEKDTAVAPRDDGIMVYVDGTAPDDQLAGYGENDFRLRFKQHKGAYYVHASGVTDMMNKLRELSVRTGKPIAELEIVGHGMPGRMTIGEEQLSVYSGSQLQPDYGRVSFAKDATIRLQSCFAGANNMMFGKTGEIFMKELGTSLLDQGGTVVASNRIIYVTSNFPESVRKNHQSIPAAYLDKALDPLDVLMHAGLSAMLTHDGPYRRVKIPARKH